MENLKSVAAVYLALLSFTCYVIIYTYPAGDYTSGPFMILNFGTPVILMHIALCFYYYVKKKSNWVIWASVLLSLLSLINVTWFVNVH